MSGYISDWREAEEGMQRALAAHPDCTRRRDCPTDDHLVDCIAYRRQLYPDLYAKLDAQLAEMKEDDD